MGNLETASETLQRRLVIVRSALFLLITFAGITDSLCPFSRISSPAVRNIAVRQDSSKAINGSFQFDQNQNLNRGKIIMQIPTFLLRKLYLKGSLENVDDGFMFKIKNTLSPGTVTAMEPIKVNGTEYPIDALTVKIEDTEYTAADVNEGSAMPLKVGVEIALHIKADPLPEGEHTIDIALVTKEAGRLAFDVKDAI